MKKIVFLMFAATILIGGCMNDCMAQTFVDLGLKSGTKWCDVNETGFYKYDEAVIQFGNRLPTSADWEELKNECVWKFMDSEGGLKVVGPNGKSITLPAEGSRKHKRVYSVGRSGFYWSSTPSGRLFARYFYFDLYNKLWVGAIESWRGLSVRLVQK